MTKLRAEGIDTLVPVLSSGGKEWLARTRPVALLAAASHAAAACQQ